MAVSLTCKSGLLGGVSVLMRKKSDKKKEREGRIKNVQDDLLARN